MRDDPSTAVSHQVGADHAGALFPGRHALPVPRTWQPTLVVVIDTEEEFDWRAPPNPASRAVRNIQSLPLLQAVFDRHGIVPAYVVDHPVAEDPAAVRVLRGFADAGRCEIGAHLHPWVTPPVEETIDAWHVFACNLPPDLERRKLQTLTRLITSAFGAPPRIFRAGNYGVGAHTAGILADLGYTVDTSIVPFTDFRRRGGQNFEDWSATPFRSAEGIVEIPLTVGFAGLFSGLGPRVFRKLDGGVARAIRLPGIAARLALLERLRLSPEGHTLDDMQRLTHAGLARGERLFMMSLHSSSLLPGATEYVHTEAGRAAFIDRIDRYIGFFMTQVRGRPGMVSQVAAALAAGPADPAN